jgi:hypothetical protein
MSKNNVEIHQHGCLLTVLFIVFSNILLSLCFIKKVLVHHTVAYHQKNKSPVNTLELYACVHTCMQTTFQILVCIYNTKHKYIR